MNRGFGGNAVSATFNATGRAVDFTGTRFEKNTKNPITGTHRIKTWNPETGIREHFRKIVPTTGKGGKLMDRITDVEFDAKGKIKSKKKYYEEPR
ncbi:MAG: hypothetical protein WC602_04510 [archaeon]